MTEFVQYLLWPDCKMGCPFCFLRGSKFFNASQKIQRLKHLQQCLADDVNDGCIDLSLIGGEIFDGQLEEGDVKEEFYKLLNLVCELHSSSKIRRLMLATSLAFDIDKWLIPALSYLKQNSMLDSTLVCASYDTAYRFNDKSLASWESSMKKLVSMREVNLHIEMILTRDAIRKIMNGQLDLQAFGEKHHARVDFIEPTFTRFYGSKQEMINQLPDFFPARAEFIDLVMKKCIHEKVIDMRALLDMKLRGKKIRTIDPCTCNPHCIEDRWTSDYRRFEIINDKVELYSSQHPRASTYSNSNLSMAYDIERLRQCYS